MPKKAVSKAAKPIKEISVAAYTHVGRKRTNNPPVGLVSTATASVDGVKTYQHDPNIDPSLSWAGKAEGMSFEVPDLSLHVHERIDPRRIVKSFMREQKGLKQQSLFEYAENKLPLNKAIEFYSHDQDWSNRLIAGDSLLVMNSLLQKEGMGGKVQMIYFDPPYGIRYNSNFQPFVAKKEVKDGNDADIPNEPEIIRAFRDTWQLEIHSYLTYIRDRLLLAKNLLSESGSCFVQINDENLHYIREVMQEVFGKDNYISTIVFTKKGNQKGGNIQPINDNIVWFAKNQKAIKFHPLFTAKSEDYFTYVELPDGSELPLERLKSPDGSKREYASNPEELSKDYPGARIFQRDNLTSGGIRKNQSLPFTVKGVTFSPPAGNCWKTTVVKEDGSKSGMQMLAESNRISVGKTTFYFKRYPEDFGYSPITNIWTDTGGAANAIYVVQTAEKVIQRCLLMTTDPDDLVLDITCGSGTTAVVAEQWGRRWITCDTSRVAIALAKQRLMTAYFDYYKLAHPTEGLSGGFDYKRVPHIMLGSIANNEPPENETLYDQPKFEKDKIRVAGPLTVEAVPCLRIRPFEQSDKSLVMSGNAVARVGETANYSHWCDELKASGIRATAGNFLQFSRIEPMSGTKWLHAEGEILDSVGQNQKAYISFGPDFGPLEQRQVEQAVQEAMALEVKPNFLIFAAFHFDPEAAKDIDQMRFAAGSVTILKAQMSVDLLTEDLRKKRSSNQSFWLIGQPDIEVIPDANGSIRIKVNGFDYYNPLTGEIDSGGANKIAMWMLDTDYDEQSLLPDQVFFPMQDSSRDWTKLMKALNGAVDEELAESFTGVESLPFSPGSNRKIAVKIIDDRGIESFVVKSV